MRIALFGGSFDPPHCGHIGIALAAARSLALDRVLMAPVGSQPLKRGQPQSPYADRLAMVRLACAGHSPIKPSDVEAPVGSGPNYTPNYAPNYTYDTLIRLRATLAPGDTLYCLIGADSLQTLHHWHRAAEALLLAEWIVAARPGFALHTLDTLLPPGITASETQLPTATEHAVVRVPLRATQEGQQIHGTLWLLPNLEYDVSATALRTALADHSAGITQRILNPQVAEYARTHRLYEGEAFTRAHA